MLRRAVVWLCRTPQRLAASAVTVLVVVLVGGAALNSGGPAITGATGAGGPTAPPTAAQVPDAGRYVAAAVGFVRLWAAPASGQTAAQWQASLAPLATTGFAEELTSTDLAGLPGAAVQGESVVRFVAQSSALVAVPLSDGSSVLVSLVDEGGVTRVSNVQPNVGD